MMNFKKVAEFLTNGGNSNSNRNRCNDMIQFTVAICTYNGAERIASVLECLRLQAGIEDISWEIIVVDNNSNDQTAQVIQNYQLQWNKPYPIKYYFEPKQGVAFARRRAIQEAKSDLIGFLDDDNYPDSDWVAKAVEFGQNHPKAGVYGSRIRGEFEVEPPPDFQRIACYFVITERKKIIQFESYRRGRVAGAGMVIRRQAWLDCVPEQLFCLGRVGNSLSAKGEELEAQAYLSKAGWEIWYNAEMVIHHKFPKWRFEKTYLLDYFHHIGLSRYYIRMLGYADWQKPLMTIVYLLSDLRKVLLHYMKYHKVLETDVVASCEMEFFVSSFYSPFHFYKKIMFG
jgi:glycosyltransferase involved in cell wall biosynthesis